MQKVKYNRESDWDFYMDAGLKAIDLSLILPHYRAQNQPVEHRMSMSIVNDSAPIKLKIVRLSPTRVFSTQLTPMSLSKQCSSYQRSNFCLKVVADTSDVTIWFPSDFKGQIRYCGQPTFSISNVGGALWALYDAVRRGTLTFALWDTAQRCTVLYSFPQRDSVGPKIRNC